MNQQKTLELMRDMRLHGMFEAMLEISDSIDHLISDCVDQGISAC